MYRLGGVYDERSSIPRSLLSDADDMTAIHVKGGVPYAARICSRARLVHCLPYRPQQLTYDTNPQRR